METTLQNQREAYLKDQMLATLSNNTPISYVGCLHAKENERQEKFVANCVSKRLPITIPSIGINLELTLEKSEITEREVYFESNMIFNGIAVKWSGIINKSTLNGQGKFEFDNVNAKNQEQMAREMMAGHGERIQRIRNSML
uniref:PilZ domain-containing protein n=1 Tax=Rhabditophanes sp. KR3021 TaxID=114890 RepID=A0AC35TZX9_9BILA